jgi:hypothetical protein
VLRVTLPLHSSLSPEEFEALRQSIREHVGVAARALALAWSHPMR